MRNSGTPLHKFTLIELLVVVAVMAMLLALLLPALAKAKSTVKRIACVGNTRSLSTAMFLYADDNQDGFVPDGLSNTKGDYWQNSLYRYIYNTEPPNPASSRKLLRLSSGKFKNSVFWCPSSNYGAAELVDNAIPFTLYGSYGLNVGLYLKYSGSVALDYSTPLRLSRMKRPSETIALTDSSKNGAASGIVSPYCLFADWYLSRLRHGSRFSDQQIDATLTLNLCDPGKTNALMLDGHCEALQYGPLQANNGFLFRQDVK